MQNSSRRFHRAIPAERPAISEALRNWDALPDSAHVREPVVRALFACSSATVWRRVKQGVIPKPYKHSARITAWRVGDLRAALDGLKSISAEQRSKGDYARPAEVA